MPRIHLVLSDVQYKWLETHSDSLRTKSAIIRDLINAEIKGLDATPRLSAYHVGAGERELSNEAEVQTSIQSLKSTSNISSISDSEKEKISPPLNRFGDGVGRECEGTPRRNHEINSIAKRKKIAPEKLKPFWDKIEDFWRVKKGTKLWQETLDQ